MKVICLIFRTPFLSRRESGETGRDRFPKCYRKVEDKTFVAMQVCLVEKHMIFSLKTDTDHASWCVYILSAGLSVCSLLMLISRQSGLHGAAISPCTTMHLFPNSSTGSPRKQGPEWRESLLVLLSFKWRPTSASSSSLRTGNVAIHLYSCHKGALITYVSCTGHAARNDSSDGGNPG
jgi:hypothetical protein